MMIIEKRRESLSVLYSHLSGEPRWLENYMITCYSSMAADHVSDVSVVSWFS